MSTPAYLRDSCNSPVEIHGSVRIGSRYQFVIPKVVRDKLSIHPGDSIITLTRAGALGLIHSSSLPRLISYIDTQLETSPQGSDIQLHSAVTVGLKGQIIIPKQVRDLLNLEIDETLTLITKDGAIGAVKNSDLPVLISYLSQHIS